MSQTDESTKRLRTIAGLGSILTLVVFLGLSRTGWNLGKAGAQRIWLQDGRVYTDPQSELLLASFSEKGIQGAYCEEGRISVLEADRTRCNDIVEQAKLERIGQDGKSNGTFSLSPWITPSQEARLERENKLEKVRSILAGFAGIQDALIVYDNERANSFQRNRTHSAVVTLWPEQGKTISYEQAETAKQVTARSFAGMNDADVLVVDGATGSSFDSSPEGSSESQALLSAIKARIVQECQSVLDDFGKAEVEVRLHLTNPALRNSPSEEENKNSIVQETVKKEQPKVVLNGSGKISENRSHAVASIESHSKRSKLDESDKAEKSIPVVQLLGINIALGDRVVQKYVQQRIGIRGDVSDEQFSRGLTSLRNEITKNIVARFHNQGVLMNSELVTLRVNHSESRNTGTNESVSVNRLEPYGYILILAALCLTAGLAFLIWKGRTSKQVIRNNGSRYRPAGRTALREDISGSSMLDELQEAVQSDPERSINAIHDLVSNKGTSQTNRSGQESKAA